jgi:peptidyl-prolyl cis-trans isomerase A (cyclophilin A)
MMRNALLMLALIGCGTDTESGEVNLKDSLTQSEADNARLKQTNVSLAKRVQSLEKEMAALKLQETYDKLGIPVGGKLGAVFHTSLGEISCALMPASAPKTVLNFVQLAEGSKSWTDPNTGATVERPLYSGTIFHRVIPNFMIQGGDPMGTGRGGPGYRFEDETTGGAAFDKPGLLAMANAGPNTNGSQFFITDRSKPSHLTGKHTIFGDCGNLDIVQAIATVPQAAGNRPTTDVVLTKVEIVR